MTDTFRWRLAIGAVLIAGGYAAWLIIPLVVASGLSPGVKTALTALFGATLTKFIAIGLLGRPTINFLKTHSFKLFRRDSGSADDFRLVPNHDRIHVTGRSIASAIAVSRDADAFERTGPFNRQRLGSAICSEASDQLSGRADLVCPNHRRRIGQQLIWCDGMVIRQRPTGDENQSRDRNEKTFSHDPSPL